jgi:hypothetical protein
MTRQLCERCQKEFDLAPHKAQWCEACVRDYFDGIDLANWSFRQDEMRAYYAELRERRTRAIADGVPVDLLIDPDNLPF